MPQVTGERMAIKHGHFIAAHAATQPLPANALTPPETGERVWLSNDLSLCIDFLAQYDDTAGCLAVVCLS